MIATPSRSIPRARTVGPPFAVAPGMNPKSSSSKTKTVAVPDNSVMNSLADAGYVQLALPAFVFAAFFYTLFELLY
jgi:hypothetical protein